MCRSCRQHDLKQIILKLLQIENYCCYYRDRNRLIKNNEIRIEGAAMLGGYKGYFTFYMLMGAACMTTFLLQGDTPGVLTNPYGTITSTDNAYIKGAIAEKFILFVQENSFSSKKIERSGLLVRYPDAIGTVVMCHGFMCDKYDQGMLRNMFPAGKYNILSFDFRAHGENTQGQYCTFGRDEAYDVTAAAQFAKNHPYLKDTPLFVYGFSMGAVAAIEAQAKDPSLFKAMILDCPFDNIENVLHRGLEDVKFTVLGYEINIPGRDILHKYAFHPYVQSLVKIVLKTVAQMDTRNITTYMCPVAPVKTVSKVSVPSLFISCKKDKRVSVEGIKSVYNNSGATYKKLWLTNGRWHFDSYFYNPEKYIEMVRNFLDLAQQGTLYTTQNHEIIEDSEDTFHEQRRG
jgi:pimeloyl-ACP methyl ester carboxylesterase